MKILITTDLFTVTTNGVVTSLKNLWRELQSRGHEVRILTFSENRKSHKDDEGVYFIGSSSLEWIYPGVRMPKTYRGKYLKELIEWKPDVIHSQCEFFSYFFALKIAKKTGAKLVHTYHTMYEDYTDYVLRTRRFAKFVVRKFTVNRLNKADWVVAPTKKVAELLERYEIKTPVAVIPTGISLDQHRQRLSEEQRKTMRKDLGFSDDNTVMMTLGRLGQEKNVDELLRFLAEAKSTLPSLRFLIVGDGPSRESLTELTKKLDLQDSVVFTGKVLPSEVQNYYQLGDFFASASTSETQGLTYIEATANALPLLCRRDPCLDEVIEQGVNGFAYTEKDEFMSYIEKIVTDTAWRKSAGENSYRSSLKFDKSVFGNSVEKIYNELLGKA